MPLDSELLSAVITFAAFIVITELLDTELPSGIRLQLSLAPALAFAMLEGARIGPNATPVVVGTYVVAAAIAAIFRVLRRREVRLRTTIGSIITIAGSAAAYGALRNVGPTSVLSDGVHQFVYSASLVGLGCVLCIVLVTAALAVMLVPNGTARGLGRSISSLAPLHTAVVSVAALVALAFPKLNWWSFPLFLGPLAATRYAFRQIASIRTTEVQTLRALSKIPELAGYTTPGHSRRVAELSVAIATDLGVNEEHRRDIEYAALLHDIGRVVLEDPGADQTTALRNRDVAATGANIVAAAGTFPRVAEMIREQDEPYRRRGQYTNDAVALGSRILKVANTYDDLLHGKKESVDALERLHMGKAYDFDPDVVASLTRILANQT